jgi:hypothetical protein
MYADSHGYVIVLSYSQCGVTRFGKKFYFTREFSRKFGNEFFLVKFW